MSGAGGVSGASGAAGKGTAGSTGGGNAAGSGSTGNCATPPTGSALVGWAAQAGMGVTTTTGGGDAAPQTVSSLAALTSAVSGTAAKVIYVSGFSNLIGAADNVAGDVGHLNVTWHHDWWADNVNQRMPRTRAGKVHLFNNLFTAAGNSYCSNAGQGAASLVENSIYKGVKAPFQVDSNSVGLVSKGNTFPGSTGNTTGSGTAFTPPYSYTPDDTNNLQASIQANAGPQ